MMTEIFMLETEMKAFGTRMEVLVNQANKPKYVSSQKAPSSTVGAIEIRYDD